MLNPDISQIKIFYDYIVFRLVFSKYGLQIDDACCSILAWKGLLYVNASAVSPKFFQVYDVQWCLKFVAQKLLHGKVKSNQLRGVSLENIAYYA